MTMTELLENVYPNTLTSISDDLSKQIFDTLAWAAVNEIDDHDTEMLGKKITANLEVMNIIKRYSNLVVYEDFFGEEMQDFHVFCLNHPATTISEIKAFCELWNGSVRNSGAINPDDDTSWHDIWESHEFGDK